MSQHSIAIIESWLNSQQSLGEYVLEVLATRFGADAAQIFKPALDTIDDAQRLKQLLDAAVLVNNVEDFRRALEATEVEGFLECRKSAMPQY